VGEMSGLKLPGLPDQLRGESEAGFVMGCGSASGYFAIARVSSAIGHLNQGEARHAALGHHRNGEAIIHVVLPSASP